MRKSSARRGPTFLHPLALRVAQCVPSAVPAGVFTSARSSGYLKELIGHGGISGRLLEQMDGRAVFISIFLINEIR